MSAFDGALFLLWLVYFPIPFFWLTVHPFADFWRRQRGRAHLVLAVSVWVVVDSLLAVTRAFWFAARFPRNPWSYLLGAVLVGSEVAVLAGVKGALGLTALIGRPEVDPQRHPPHLVEAGIYARVRHPAYLGAMAVLFGVAVLAGSFHLLLLAGLSVPLFYLMTVAEERELASRLGDSFRRYQQSVPRFIPRLWN